MAAIDKLIHERARLLIVTYLASSDEDEVSFNELQKNLSFTSGNLSIQLKKLIAASYVEMKKTFKDNKPYTTIAITNTGRAALEDYVLEMESILQGIKKRKASK